MYIYIIIYICIDFTSTYPHFIAIPPMIPRDVATHRPPNSPPRTSSRSPASSPVLAMPSWNGDVQICLMVLWIPDQFPK